VSSKLLYIIYQLSKKYTMNISELTGASHSFESKHYFGRAIDINYIDGKHVEKSNFSKEFCVNFEKEALKLGARLVLRPYRDAYHDTHFHIQA